MTRLRRPRVIAVAAVVLVATAVRVEAAAEGSEAPLPDSRFYVALAGGLYEDGAFDGRVDDPGPLTPVVERPESFTPAVPFLAAGAYLVAGSEDKAAARIAIALLGGAAALFTYLIGARLGGFWAGLVGAAMVAVYPALIDYHRMLMTEPLGAALLVAAIWALLRALERGRGWPSWLLAGALLGLTALTRSEYLAVGLLLVAAAGAVALRRDGARRALPLGVVGAAGVILAVAPWTIHNAISFHRLLPIADGGGKALFEGTYVPAYDHGFTDPDYRVLRRERIDYPWLDRELAELYGADAKQEAVGRNLDAIGAHLYPGLRWDEVGATLGRENLDRYAWGDPLGFAGFLARKQAFVWSHGATDAMNAVGWRTLHLALVAFALAGLVLLGLRRRPEAAILGALFVAALILAALTQPTPRRNLVLVPEMAALAGFAIAAASASLSAALDRRRGPTGPDSQLDSGASSPGQAPV